MQFSGADESGRRDNEFVTKGATGLHYGMAASTDEATGERDRTDDVQRETSVVGTGRALVGGFLGGIAGTAAFGLLSVALGLGFVQSFIPALFGMGQSGVVGWTVHLAAGAVLGVVFGLLVSRPRVHWLVVPDAREPALGPASPSVRLVGLGIAYGLAVWAILPMLVLPVWLGVIGVGGVDAVPGSALTSLAAHLVFGLLLGAVYAAVVYRR